MSMDGASAAKVQDGRRRDRLLGNEPRPVGQRFERREMMHGQRLSSLQFAFDHHARRRKLDVTRLVVKPRWQRALEAHAFDAFDEIHEPVPASQLAVGAHLEAGIALQRQRILDCPRFDRPQLVRR